MAFALVDRKGSDAINDMLFNELCRALQFASKCRFFNMTGFGYSLPVEDKLDFPQSELFHSLFCHSSSDAFATCARV